MESNEPVRIEHIGPHGDGDLYDLSNDYGYIDAIYSPDGIYQISSIVVSSRRKGHGQNLLRKSEEHARELGARKIGAVIISRECLEAMTRVFGEDSLTVLQRGEFTPEGHDYNTISPTQALLRYTLAPRAE